MKNRLPEQVLEDIKLLIHSKGYIYALCMILYEDFHHNLDKIHEVNFRANLSIKECSFIIGLLVQQELDFTFPETPENVIRLKEKTYELMEEFHWTLNSPQMEKLKALMEKQALGEDISEYSMENLDLFAKEGGMVEPMFYAGDGVYDFQYLEYLERKYRYDKKWLWENKKFSISDVPQIVQKIKQILHTKSQQVTHLDIKNNFPKVVQKATKKLKKQYSEEKIKELAQEQLVMMTFFQYRALFKNDYNKQHADKEEWEYFYKNLVDLFVVRRTDFDDEPSISHFLNNFSFIPDVDTNKAYNGPGYFNILNERPLIKIDLDSYFVPLNFLISEAIYESPFYWMYGDKDYMNKASKHRGDVGEEMAYDYLSKVFGKENTFKSVLATTKKGEPNTDIDVLCLLGNKALCVQVKSKKVTMAAKRGDFEQLSKDFKGAVQDAYDQGVVSRSCLLSNNTRFTDIYGNEISINKDVNEVYIMGLTTENHPALVHQVRTLLNKEKDAPYPLVLSVFDLELLAHYLPDPYDFLYYIRQRIDLIDYFLADEELGYLGYHLQQKLWKDEEYDGGYIDNVFGAMIDRNYYPFKTGLTHLLSDKNDPILNRWKDPKFDHLIDVIKHSRHTKSTDIIFNLLDWSGETRSGLVDQMIRIKKDSIREYSDKSIATTNGSGFGFSFQVLKETSLNQLEDKVNIYSVAKKYQQKCDSWLGLGSFARSKNLVDFLMYLDEPWFFDYELEESTKDFFKKTKGKAILLNPKLSIGRNDPCPCKSGMKYKKCCALK